MSTTHSKAIYWVYYLGRTSHKIHPWSQGTVFVNLAPSIRDAVFIGDCGDLISFPPSSYTKIAVLSSKLEDGFL